MWHAAAAFQSVHPATGVLVATLPRLTSPGMDALAQHIAACNTARLPGKRLPLWISGKLAGFVRPNLAAPLAAFPAVRHDSDGLHLTDPSALPGIVRALAQDGYFHWRNEAFDVRAAPDGPVLAQADRGGLPSFGIFSVGVHVNGLVRTARGLHLWVAHRAPDKHLDPGKLDHLVAGGVPAGMTSTATLVKEAAEEAAVPPDLARHAAPVGRIAYALERTEGLRRDLLLCYDLELPDTFTPHPADGEVARFELWPIARVLATVQSGDAFKFNVNLVLIDLFLRHGLIVGEDATPLRAALGRPAPGAPGVPLA